MRTCGEQDEYLVRRDMMSCAKCGRKMTRHVKVVWDGNGWWHARLLGEVVFSGEWICCPGCGASYPDWEMESSCMVAMDSMAIWGEKPCV